MMLAKLIDEPTRRNCGKANFITAFETSQMPSQIPDRSDSKPMAEPAEGHSSPPEEKVRIGSVYPHRQFSQKLLDLINAEAAIRVARFAAAKGVRSVT